MKKGQKKVRNVGKRGEKWAEKRGEKGKLGWKRGKKRGEKGTETGPKTGGIKGGKKIEFSGGFYPNRRSGGGKGGTNGAREEFWVPFGVLGWFCLFLGVFWGVILGGFSVFLRVWGCYFCFWVFFGGLFWDFLVVF